MFEVCNDQYADAPEGVPTWCVELDTGWETWAQLGGELILFVLLFMIVRQIKLWFQSRRLRRQYLKQIVPLPLVSNAVGLPEQQPTLYVPDIPHTSDSASLDVPESSHATDKSQQPSEGLPK